MGGLFGSSDSGVISEVANGIQLPSQSSASSDVNADQVTISASAASTAKGICIDQSHALDLLVNELQASSTEVAAQECAADEIARQNIALFVSDGGKLKNPLAVGPSMCLISTSLIAR